jgi:hypothetical protein
MLRSFGAQVWLILGFLSVGAGSSVEASSFDLQSSKFELFRFGITERVMTQTVLRKANYSTLLSWNPQYRLSDVVNLEFQLGGAGMTSNLHTFFVSRYQGGASLHRLIDSSDHFVPELLLGAETWWTKYGGTYFSANLNFHYRFGFSGFWSAFDSVFAGYQWLPGAPVVADQISFGGRCSVLGFSSRHPSRESLLFQPGRLPGHRIASMRSSYTAGKAGTPLLGSVSLPFFLGLLLLFLFIKLSD